MVKFTASTRSTTSRGKDDDGVCEFLGILEAKLRLGIVKYAKVTRNDIRYYGVAISNLNMRECVKDQLRFLRCEFGVNQVYKEKNGTKTRRSTCKPIFCVVQLVRQYNIHESELIDEMKKSDEWELSDGHEYFAPQISSEDARKWITHHFNKINPSLSSFSGIKEDIFLYLKDQAKCTQKYLGSLEDWKDLDKIEETGCTNATEYQCEYCLKKHNTFDALRTR